MKLEDVKNVAILAAIAAGGYLLWKYVGPYLGPVFSKPAPLQQTYPTGNANIVPVSILPGIIPPAGPGAIIWPGWGGLSAQQVQTSLESIPLAGDPLANLFSSSYGLGVAAGNDIKSVLGWLGI